MYVLLHFLLGILAWGGGTAELRAIAECSTAVNKDKDCVLPCSHG